MPYEQVANYPRSNIRQVLSDSNSFSTTMIVSLVDFYGTEFTNWSPETIRMETEEDFSFHWPPTNFDRLMVGINILKTNDFYKSLPDFIDGCNILSGAPATPGQFDLAEADECAWGITEVLLLSPPDDETPFSEEICAYIGKVIDMEGIIVPPDILRIGLTDGNKKHQVRTDYGDDPEMYNAIWDAEAEKTEEINSLIRERLTLLVEQLSNLKLKNGNTEAIAKNMLAGLKVMPAGGSSLNG